MYNSMMPPPAEDAKERYKIICVDDVQCSLSMLKRRLMGQYEVYPAESTEIMYKVLEKVKPDLIIMDVNMPDIDGFDALKSLKENEKYTNIPVIFLTGNKDKESVFKGLHLGAVDYLVKPFETANMIACIEKHVAASRSEKPAQDSEDDGRPRILAVDDVVSILKTIQIALRNNYRVYTLARPESVVDFLKLRKPDLILLDYLMPVLNGFELIPMIKELPDHINTPIIMLTSEGSLPQIKEAIALGAVDFVVKPFKESELKEKIAKHIKMNVVSQATA